jgi:peptidoglycan hydrolase-like protein with peptidoglycan-binding domain
MSDQLVEDLQRLGVDDVIELYQHAKLLATAGLPTNKIINTALEMAKDKVPIDVFNALVAASSAIPEWTPSTGGTTSRISRSTAPPPWWLNRFTRGIPPPGGAIPPPATVSGPTGPTGPSEAERAAAEAEARRKAAEEEAARLQAEEAAKAAADAAAKAAADAAAKAAADAAAAKAATDAAAAKAAPTLPNVTSSSSTWLRSGSRGSEVTDLQNTLKYLGYDIGSTGVDGIFGSRTKSAVEAFQRASHIGVDGIVGPQTISALKAATTAKSGGTAAPAPTTTAKPALPNVTSSSSTWLRSGSSGSNVTNLQKTLIYLGYSVGSTGADGKFGANTKSGVQAFQRAKGLSADGVVGPKTMSALRAAVG